MSDQCAPDAPAHVPPSEYCTILIVWRDAARGLKVVPDIPRYRQGERWAEQLFEDLMPQARRDALRMELLEQPAPGQEGRCLRRWERGRAPICRLLEQAEHVAAQARGLDPEAAA